MSEKKVFVVTAGNYSDYHIEAVFSTRRDAEIFVANRDDDFYGDPDIEEYEIDRDVSQMDADIVYAYVVRDGKINATDIIRKSKIKKFRENAKAMDNWYRRMENKGKGICVFLDKPSKTKALKIAQDKLAEQKALEEGI